LRPYGQENLLIDSIRKQAREVIMVNEPVIEAVMIGIQGQTSISFVRPGFAIQNKQSTVQLSR
jgi:hypothetical protein